MVKEPLNPLPRRFVFHGNAVGAEVFLTRVGNVEQSVISPVTGQCSLPVIGGESSSQVLDPDIPEQLQSVFSYTNAQTRATGTLYGDGTQEKDHAVTTVAASLENVSVKNWSPDSPDRDRIEFRAGKLALSMRSTHPSFDQPSIEFIESAFEGLSLNGQPIQVDLNRRLMALSRWGDLQNAYQTDRAFFESCPFAQDAGVPPLCFGHGIPCPAGSFALSSFVRSIRWGPVEIPGHVLAVDGFGVIYFGEILLNDRERRVTMVRIRLGCKHAGQAVFVENAPNGTWVPPR